MSADSTITSEQTFRLAAGMARSVGFDRLLAGPFAFSPNHRSGTARGFENTNAVSAPGWLSVRRSFPFFQGLMAKCIGALGTGLRTWTEPLRRPASGWLFARAAAVCSHRHRDRKLGTVSDHGRTDVAPAAGWLSASASGSFAPEGYHVPVMPAEIVEMMQAGPGKFIIDGTLGGGGHSELLLKQGATVLGVDRDPEALAHATQRLAGFGSRFSTFHGNFSEIPSCEKITAGELADGLLLDLGVSSRQLDSAERGFSFMRMGPLDMRMGPNARMTAAEWVNRTPESEMARVFYTFGEEPRSRRIAAAIAAQRLKKSFSTTLELAGCIEQAVGRNSKIHPATRSFQAIRMAINEELESLASVLESAAAILKPGGRLLIITFHSLEDRMVKRFLSHHSRSHIDDPTWPAPRPNPDFKYRLMTKKAITPTQEEIRSNPRARSAKLRVAELSGLGTHP